MCEAVGESTHLGKGLAFLGATLARANCGFKCDSDGSWTSVLISATKLWASKLMHTQLPLP